MDIIDILMAKKLSATGQIDTYATKARQAVTNANNAIAAIDTITQQTNTNNERAAAAAQTAEAAAAQVTQALNNLEHPVILYDGAGQHTDGAMTQKATTDYVASEIAKIPVGGGSSASINLGSQNAGKLVMVANDGSLAASNTTESEVANLLNNSATPVTNTGIIGLEIDYSNKQFTRLYDAVGLTMGHDFDQFRMYGGRKRCNVAVDGTINAFYGEPGYADDGSNGQVMVYQPAFYFKRVIVASDTTDAGTIVRKEQLLLSDTAQDGFTKHWCFRNLDYALFSAYEGSLVNNKLMSVANQMPAAGYTIHQFETYAEANGNGWYITSMDLESINQMLLMVESGMVNGQTAIELGISNTDSILYTGSTASLGNATGHATSSTDGSNTYTENGKRAISYRGMENPWGNLWRFLSGVTIQGDGYKNGGEPAIGNVPLGFYLPNISGWISAMGLGRDPYTWVYLPAECAASANSALPVGDNIWVVANINRNGIIAVGGSYNQGDRNGPFYYACDRNYDHTASNYGARIKFAVSNNNIYTANIAKWNTLMGG